MKTNKLKRYDAYKPSGVEWSGEIPEHWEVKKGWMLLEEGKLKNLGMKRTKVLSLSYGNIKVKGESILTGLVPESFETYQLVDKGDIIFRPTDLQNDKVSLRSGISDFEGIITSAYINIRPKAGNDNKYLAYYLRAIDNNKVIYGLGSGLRQNIDFSDFKKLQFFHPTLSEQTAIAQFLDTKTALIDKAIKLKEKQIALLKERRQAIIHQAVTKGLNPDVPMKDSRIEWIGEIPEHWEVKKAKFIFNKIEQGWSPLCDNYIAGVEEWGVLKVGCVNGFDFNPFENKVLPVNLKPKMEYRIQQGDILISRANTQELVGSAAFVERIEHKLLLCDKLYRIRIIREKINPEFYIFLLKSSYARRHIEIHASGASPSMQNIGQDCIKEMLLFLPSIAEQGVIVAYLKGLIKKISDSLCLKEQEIEKLKEYKASLINSVVTGKIKVV